MAGVALLSTSIPALLSTYVAPAVPLIDNSRPLEFYYRMLSQLLLQADQYALDEGQDEHTFVFYMRYYETFSRMKTHNSFGTTRYSRDKAEVTRRLRGIAAKLEEIKPRLQARYDSLIVASLPPVPLPQTGQQPQIHSPRQQQQIPQQPQAQQFAPFMSSSLAFPSAPQAPPGYSDLYCDPSVAHAQSVQQMREQQQQQQQQQQQHVQQVARGALKMPAPGSPEEYALKAFRFEPEVDPTARRVEVDPAMVTAFASHAAQNTARGIETCAILAGRVSGGSLVVTHCVLPKQEATTDTCNMLDEESLFKYQDEHQLITLGWIHTHPTQSLFMSSVDLHTQFPYQQLLSEAIAIVVAPRCNPNFGVFKLTRQGLSEIGACSKRGFHQHTGQLYCEAGHVAIASQKTPHFTVVDLRKA